MPGVVMHHHFARVVYSALSDETKKKINNIALYDFACTAADAFTFVSFLSKEKNKEAKKISELLHTKNTQMFLMELAKLSKLNKDLFPFLCGYVTHYYLDVTTCPYIYYKTGIYDPDIPNSIKNRGLRLKLERAMDTYVIENYYSVLRFFQGKGRV